MIRSENFVRRYEIDAAVLVKVINLSDRERAVHDAMMEAPVEEAGVYFDAMRRLRSEITHFLRMSARPSTANLEELGLA